MGLWKSGKSESKSKRILTPEILESSHILLLRSFFLVLLILRLI